MAKVDTIPEVRRFIVDALTTGWSMRTALSCYRQAGGAIRTDDFATLWRDERRKREGAAA